MNTNENITERPEKKELKRLKKKLAGYYQEIADRSNTTKPMVSMVLSGKTFNPVIVTLAYEIEQRIDSYK